MPASGYFRDDRFDVIGYPEPEKYVDKEGIVWFRKPYRINLDIWDAVSLTYISVIHRISDSNDCEIICYSVRGECYDRLGKIAEERGTGYYRRRV